MDIPNSEHTHTYFGLCSLGLAEIFGFVAVSEVCTSSAPFHGGEKTPTTFNKKDVYTFSHFYSETFKRIRVFAASTDQGAHGVSSYLLSWVSCVSFPSSSVRSGSLMCSLLYQELSVFPIFLFFHALENLCP